MLHHQKCCFSNCRCSSLKASIFEVGVGSTTFLSCPFAAKLISPIPLQFLKSFSNVPPTNPLVTQCVTKGSFRRYVYFPFRIKTGSPPRFCRMFRPPVKWIYSLDFRNMIEFNHVMHTLPAVRFSVWLKGRHTSTLSPLNLYIRIQASIHISSDF